MFSLKPAPLKVEKQKVANTFINLVRACRLRQWTKNFIVFFPLLFSMQAIFVEKIFFASICFFAFSLAASAMYIFNDMCDSCLDANHPQKKDRPLASGKINMKLAKIVSLTLACMALILAYSLKPIVGLCVALYLGLITVYCVRLKNLAYIEMLCIAAAFALRALTGAFAIGVYCSNWLLICTVLVSLFLVLEKRIFELKKYGSYSFNCRPVLEHYSLKFLFILRAINIPSLLIIYAMYCLLSFHGPAMILTLPFLMFCVIRYATLTDNKIAYAAAPEEVLLQDRAIQSALLLWFLITSLVIYNLN